MSVDKNQLDPRGGITRDDMPPPERSSPLPGNPYAAERSLAAIGNNPYGPANMIAAAVMSLTYEQRTANLIALTHQAQRYDDQAHQALADDLRAEIETRLGVILATDRSEGWAGR